MAWKEHVGHAATNVWNTTVSVTTGLSGWMWLLLGGRSFVIAMTIVLLSYEALTKKLIDGTQFVAILGGIGALVHTRAMWGDRAANQPQDKPDGSQ